MICYLITQYPKVSHSFIRREIAALERAGLSVVRFAFRGWDEPVVDPADIAEKDKTGYLLKDGVGPLAAAVWAHLRGNTRRFLRAAAASARFMRRTDRSVFLHLITLAEACLLARRLADTPVSHIHAHFGTNSAECAMLASLLSDIPYSFTAHGPDEFDRPQFMKLRDKVHASKFAVAISSYTAGQLYRWIDLADYPKIQCVRCGLDDAYFAAAYQPPEHPHRFVSVGRLSGQKGQAILIKAVRRVRDAGYPVELVLVGDGELRAPLEKLIRDEGVADAVRISGWADGDAVRREILAARGLILTSFAEGLPVVYMEAMALMRVVLASNVAGTAELVRQGENGWLFAAGSVEDAAQAMIGCLKTPEARLAEMGLAAQAAVRARHRQTDEAATLARLFATPAEQFTNWG